MLRSDVSFIKKLAVQKSNWGTGSNFLLKEDIRKTDWLIDQIVYRLYGLKDEEIKVIEKAREQ